MQPIQVVVPQLNNGLPGFATGPPRVDIIIVNYNGRDVIEKCIDQVLASNYPKIHIIVVDNRSTDDSPEIVRKNYPDVVLLKSERNLGYGGAINRGLNHSNAEFALVLNTDAFVQEETITELVKCALLDQRIICIQPKVYRGFTPVIDSAGAFTSFPLGYDYHLGHGEKDHGQWDTTTSICYAYGAACLLRKGHAERIGSFDEDFFLFHEESDLCWRARRLGYKIISCPRAVVWHLHSHTMTRESVDISYLMERSRILMLLKNYGRLYLTGWLLVELLHAIRVLRNKRLALPYLRSWAWNVKNLAKTVLKRRRSLPPSTEPEVKVLSAHRGFPSFFRSRRGKFV